MKSIRTLVMAMLTVLCCAACGEERKSDTEVPGREESTKTDVLETGAAALQT